MAVLGALLKKAVGGYAKKPTVPTFEPVDPTVVQQQTIEGNLKNLGAAQDLAAQQNKFNLSQLQSMLRETIPGYDNILNQQSKLLQSQLKGEIPQDVQDAIQNSSAAAALGGGYQGSVMQGKRVARDFGLTSLDITRQAMDSASRWMQMTASMAMPSMFDASTMFFTPTQRLQHAVNERNAKFNVDWTKNQIRAMPDPWKQALGDAFIQEEYEIMKLIGSVAGMAAGACWVAREVYGEQDSRWKLFRYWLLNIGPKWFRNLYLKFGQRFAKWLSDKPTIKAIIRLWMNKKVELAYGRIISRA